MSTQPLTSADLQQFIDEHQIEATILPMNEHTLTVPDAARALQVDEKLGSFEPRIAAVFRFSRMICVKSRSSP